MKEDRKPRPALEVCGVSCWCRLFRNRRVGTPHSVLILIQSDVLRAACNALALPEGRRDIPTITEGIGFCTPSAFSRAFRREFGLHRRSAGLRLW